jgi:hypothetical protein
MFKTLSLLVIACMLSPSAYAQKVIQTGVQLTVNQTGFSAVHFLNDTYQFEVYSTGGQTLTGKLSGDASFQVNLNAPNVQYWPYAGIELSAADGEPSTVVQNYFNDGSSNFTLVVYGPDGIVHNGPVQTPASPGFAPLGTLADLGITGPGDFYLKLSWQQKPVSSTSAYRIWEGTLLNELSAVGVKEGQIDQMQTWLATHTPTP